jgi:DNA-directed RNA polymerase subunit RPC12/RpoP
MLSTPLISSEGAVKEAMIVSCPKCGEKIVVKGLGRKPLNIPLKNVCECLKKHRSVAGTANELGCSESYIFKVLKANGLRLRDVLGKER